MEEYNDIKELFEKVYDLSLVQIKMINDEINNIIKNHIKDVNQISKVFDSILSLVFVDDIIREESYNKLLNYCFSVDENLAEDYQKIYYELYHKSKFKIKKIKKIEGNKENNSR